MRLSAPNRTVWWIAVVLGGLGLLGALGILAIPYPYWLTFAGFAILVVATAAKGL